MGDGLFFCPVVLHRGGAEGVVQHRNSFLKESLLSFPHQIRCRTSSVLFLAHVRYESQYGGVSSVIFNHCVCAVDSRAVVCEGARAEHTALWCTHAQDLSRTSFIPHSRKLESVFGAAAPSPLTHVFSFVLFMKTSVKFNFNEQNVFTDEETPATFFHDAKRFGDARNDSSLLVRDGR